MDPTTLEDTNSFLKSNPHALFVENKKDLTKKPRRRRRVLDFDNLKDPELIEKTEQQIEALINEVKGKPLISLRQWCNDREINPTLLVRLFNEENFPIIRIGEFQGVYELHLSRILEKESKRQVEQQLKNRVCARIVTLQQYEKKRKEM